VKQASKWAAAASAGAADTAVTALGMAGLLHAGKLRTMPRCLQSAGSAAGIDLLLHIVRKDFGAEAANRVARRLVMPPHREGGQAQYIERPVPPRADGRLAPLLDAVRARPERRWTIAALAHHAAMSERNFVRQFRKITGSSPGEWLVALRVELARDLLERDGAPVEAIAAAAGFGGVATLRHHFRLRHGLSPTAYRARFSRRT
jgi:AraC family transcriptional regulator, transcriptional activator FtrA